MNLLGKSQEVRPVGEGMQVAVRTDDQVVIWDLGSTVDGSYGAFSGYTGKLGTPGVCVGGGRAPRDVGSALHLRHEHSRYLALRHGRRRRAGKGDVRKGKISGDEHSDLCDMLLRQLMLHL